MGPTQECESLKYSRPPAKILVQTPSESIIASERIFNRQDVPHAALLDTLTGPDQVLKQHSHPQMPHCHASTAHHPSAEHQGRAVKPP